MSQREPTREMVEHANAVVDAIGPYERQRLTYLFTRGTHMAPILDEVCKWQFLVCYTHVEPQRRYDHDEIRRLHLAGLTHRQVAEIVGCSRVLVTNVVNREVEKRGPAPRRGRPRKHDHDRIRELLASGMTFAEVAAEVGCSKSCVRHVHYGY